MVVTGDLFDSPTPNAATQFLNFRNGLTRMAKGSAPVVITGNHDQRLKGLFGADYSEIDRLGTQKLVVDDASEMLFICFNSSVRGSFARGHITKSQFRQVGGEFRNALAANKRLKQYLPIVLVHHHPYSFDVEPETWVQRMLRLVGMKEEKLLELKDAEELHSWCADWRIGTILHGHKHQARYEARQVSGTDGSELLLTAIGCGSSLGAEGSPASYNLLRWDSRSRKWVASFYQSANGGAFREMMLSVSTPLSEVALPGESG